MTDSHERQPGRKLALHSNFTATSSSASAGNKSWCPRGVESLQATPAAIFNTSSLTRPQLIPQTSKDAFNNNKLINKGRCREREMEWEQGGLYGQTCHHPICHLPGDLSPTKTLTHSARLPVSEQQVASLHDVCVWEYMEVCTLPLMKGKKPWAWTLLLIPKKPPKHPAVQRKNLKHLLKHRLRGKVKAFIAVIDASRVQGSVAPNPLCHSSIIKPASTEETSGRRANESYRGERRGVSCEHEVKERCYRAGKRETKERLKWKGDHLAARKALTQAQNRKSNVTDTVGWNPKHKSLLQIFRGSDNAKLFFSASKSKRGQHNEG